MYLYIYIYIYVYYIYNIDIYVSTPKFGSRSTEGVARYEGQLVLLPRLAEHGWSSAMGFSEIPGANSERTKHWDSTNANPGWINHGLWQLGGVLLQVVTIWYLNGIPPIKQPRGLLIQGWHY